MHKLMFLFLFMTDSCEVRREQIFTNPAIESKEVPPENRVRGHRYGKQLIPFSAEMMQACKYETERHIKVLGFMPSNAINRYLNMLLALSSFLDSCQIWQKKKNCCIGTNVWKTSM